MRITMTIAASIWVILGFYVSGFDFDSRGTSAMLLYFFCTIAAGAVYFYPGWYEK